MVRLRPAGLAAGDTARVEVDLVRAIVFPFGLDRRCDARAGGVTCVVSASDTTPIDLLLIAASGATVTATLDPGVADPDLGNNTWRAVLD